MAKKIISIPNLGDAAEVEVIEICVKPGDSIGPEDPIVVLESDKAAMELPANTSGTVSSILVNVGDGVSEGVQFVEIETVDEADTAVAPEHIASDIQAPENSVKTADDLSTVNESQTNILSVPIPNLGESTEVEIIEVCVKEGDVLEAEAPLVVLESDKAAMEVPTPQAGKVIKIHQSLGAQVSEGMLLVDLEVSEPVTPEASPTAVVADNTSSVVESPKGPAPTAVTSEYRSVTTGKVYAGPAVRKLAREFGINLSEVSPSGPKGRIIKTDLHTFVKQKLASPPPSSSKGFNFTTYDIDFSQWGEVTAEPLTKFQKAAFKNLHTSWINIPHVTQHDEADITDLLAARALVQKERYTKISPLAFFIKALCKALLKFPLLNSSLNESLDGVVIKNYLNIGVAVDTPYGLIVPSIKNAQQLGILEIGEEVNRLAELAKNRKLTNKELQGGSFSVSSLGGIGGKFFTPIINPPEVGILGISKVFTKVCLEGNKPVNRTFLPLSLSYDHRVINGAYAAAFIAELSQNLSNPLWIGDNMDHG